MQKLLRFLVPIFSISFIFSACSSYEAVLKSKDINFKLAKANEYYEKKDYQKANELYGMITPILRGTKSFEAVYLKYANSYFNLKDYLSASLHYKNYVEVFPTSKETENAEYMHALCLFKLAPKASLEQTNTLKALDALQSFIDTHPTSSHIAEANKLIANSVKKLEQKEADAAQLYFKIGQYKAASVSFKSVLRNYPESEKSDYYQYFIIKSLYLYAHSSIETKQKERYSNVLTAFEELQNEHPNSTFMKDAEKYKNLSINFLKTIDNELK
jgi:outer membrane protein assembly factor BamD